MQTENKYGSFLHIIAVALVLSLPGITLLALLQTIDLEKQWNEQAPIAIELKKNYPQDSLQILMDKLKANQQIEASSVQFISKSDAFNEMKADQTLGLNDKTIENPFLDLIICTTKNIQTSETFNSSLQNELKGISIIERSDIGNKSKTGVNLYFQKLIFILIGLSSFLFILAFFIVSYLVKSFMYRKNEIIQTMYLMGGDMESVYNPYLRIGIRQGIASALLSVVLIGLGMSILFLLMPSVFNLISLKNFMLVMLVLIILGPTLHIIRLRKIIFSLFQK